MKTPLDSLLLFFSIIKKKREKARSPGKKGSAFPEELCRQFSLAEIKAAINYFREDSLLTISIVTSGSDPECYLTNQMTGKFDVYSFGVVLFEVLCGRKVIDPTLQSEQIYLTSWACKCIENGTIYHIIDPYLKKKIAPECFEKFVEVANCCVCVTGNGIPEMREVAALELQEKADFEMETVNPHCDNSVYEEVLSCRLTRNDVHA